MALGSASPFLTSQARTGHMNSAFHGTPPNGGLEEVAEEKTEVAVAVPVEAVIQVAAQLKVAVEIQVAAQLKVAVEPAAGCGNIYLRWASSLGSECSVGQALVPASLARPREICPAPDGENTW